VTCCSVHADDLSDHCDWGGAGNWGDHGDSVTVKILANFSIVGIQVISAT
jgi:hypothetical protein